MVAINFRKLITAILFGAVSLLRAQEYVTINTLGIGVPPGKDGFLQGFMVKWTSANKGVAPCYPGGFLSLTLPGDDGQRRNCLCTVTLENANRHNP